MGQMNMNYYWERLRIFFMEKEPNVDQLGKLFSRCLKLYTMIDNFVKIFKMIEVKNKIENKLALNPSDTHF